MMNALPSFALKTPMSFLPVGFLLDFEVSFHDAVGRKFSASTSNLHRWLNRFDLTEFRANGGFLRLSHAGLTLMTVNDKEKLKLADFVSVPVGEVIGPVDLNPVTGDIICLATNIGINNGTKVVLLIYVDYF